MKSFACKECWFWQAPSEPMAKAGYPAGECRRRAPQFRKRQTGDARWPDAYPDDWCGEYMSAPWHPGDTQEVTR
jgi:hypothetical protein